MKKIIYCLLLSLISVSLSAQGLIVSGNPIAYNENIAGTGIDKVYLLNGLTGATITYASSATIVKFYRYQFALADKQQIPDSEIMTSTNGGVTTYTILNLIDSRGYLVEENGGVKAPIWIIDYSLHQPVLSSIEPIEDNDRCTYLKLFVTKSDDLYFYGVNGSQRSVTRRYTITYDNLEWKDNQFVSKAITMPAAQIGTEVIIDPPLKDTKFTLSGDQFGIQFGIPKSISSGLYSAVRVEGHILAERLNPSNNQDTSLSGSAPIQARFSGFGNEPVTSFYTWFVYARQDLNNPIARFTDRNMTYTFNQEGEYVVKLEVADRASYCVDTAMFTLNVDEFLLEVPNFFSPGTSPGSNDEFRVKYRSVIKFKCTIFNRWGNKLYEFTDPAKGWDGRYKGSYVNPGVYFYVIEATDGRGKVHKRAGDINILRGK